MSILSKAAHRFNATPIKIPMVYFTKIEKPILKSTWNHKGTWIDKAILRKNKAAALMLLTSGRITKLGQEIVLQSLISNCISITFIKGFPFTASLSKWNILNFKCWLYFIVKRWSISFYFFLFLLLPISLLMPFFI